MHQHGHSHGGSSHSHGGSPHSHDGSPKSETSDGADVEGGDHHDERKNINVRAAYIHVIGDFIQSAGVFVAAVVIYYKVSKVHDDVPACVRYP